MADIDDLLARLAAGLAEGADRGVPLPTRLCRSAARVLGCDGGALTLAPTPLERLTLTTTDATARALEEAQDVVGEGPGHDALVTGAYSRLDLTARGGPDPRWPLLDSECLAVLAPLVVHSFPMLQGREVVGVMTLHQRGTGRGIGGEVDVDAALAVARVVSAALLADGRTQDTAADVRWSAAAEVRRATGMVVAQLGIPENDALDLIRAHAYSSAQSLAHTAHAVVTTELVFSGSPDRGIETT